MKIDKIIYIVIFCLSFSSCNKWLTIEPTDQVSGEKLYSNYDGYRNQLNGIYKAMAKPELYGREMQWGLMDVLAQYYEVEDYGYSAIQAYGQYGASVYKYDFPLTLSLINKIWDSAFNTIANCNDLISNIEVADASMFPNKEIEKRVIMGEAYAIRAMLHFDMLRIYAPAPIKNDDGAYIPYVKFFPTIIPNKMKSSEVLKNIIEDLEKAELLTAALDTVKKDLVLDLRLRLELSGNETEHFLEYRGYRLNYYAIKALIARVSLYAGDTEKALKYAEELINMKAFKFSSASDFRDGNTKLYSDVIFALYDNKLEDYYKAINLNEENRLVVLDYEGIFGEDGKADPVDTRELRAKQFDYNEIDQCYETNKIKAVNPILSKAKVTNKLMPMLKLSEMYYIAAECLFKTDKVKATKYLSDMRSNRKVSKSGLPVVQTQNQFNSLLLNEMRREMYGEGQLFFFYKRLNMEVVKTNEKSVILDKEFVLPIPSSNDVNN